jgi:anaerobic magnesium-protoporphyrin IX monomethyl ester cyclase
VVYLIVKPFMGKKKGPTKNEVLSRAVEHRALKDHAAELTSVPDALLERVIESEQLADPNKRVVV